ncbi:MAG: hypothetical protein WAO20_06425 [Acidobacteriota bacterium]
MSRTYPPLLLVSATVILMILASRSQILSNAGAQSADQPAPRDNEELIGLYRQDQADRGSGMATDWRTVQPRDQARRERVKDLYEHGRLHTGADFYNAAMILQHGETPEDYLLAHEFCVVAVGKGEERARWLAAASEDRFLMAIGRAQRFGTQFRSEDDGVVRLYRVGSGVTDGLRRELDVPSLEEAKAREAQFNQEQ